MEYSIEINECPANVTMDNMYDTAKYQKGGFYFCFGSLLIVHLNNYVVNLGTDNLISQFINRTENTQLVASSSINYSEDFILKLIAITNNKEKFNEVK